MPDTEDAASEDTNAAIWKSDIGVSYWKSRENDRVRRDAERRVLMAELLPFAPDEEFTFVDLGAGRCSTTIAPRTRSSRTTRRR